MKNLLIAIVNFFKSKEGKSLLSSFIRSELYSALKKQLVAKIIAIIGLSNVVGFKAWLIERFVTKFVGLAEEISKVYVRKIGYEYIKLESEVLIRKLTEARQNDNQTDYDNTVDDILS